MRQLTAEKLTSLSPRRICVIKPSALGDIVQTLPLLPVLKKAYPEAKISWVINDTFANLLENHPLIDELLIFERRGSKSSWARLCWKIWRSRFELVFDLQGLFRTGIMTLASGAKTRIGLETAREGSHLTLSHVIPKSPREMPAHARNWRLAELLGHGDTPKLTQIPTDETTIDWVNEQLSAINKPLLTISPGAQWVTKRWTIEKFAEVAARAVREYQLNVCLVGAPNERELCDSLENQIRKRASHCSLLNLGGQTSLKQLAAILQRTDLMLSNDSGPMHLAAGLGTPVVGIFLCTDAIRSGPGDEMHELVSTTVSCAASYKKRCPCTGEDHMACMRELDVERVWSALQRCVAKNNFIHSDAA